MKRVICEFENLDDWKSFIEYMDSENDPIYFDSHPKKFTENSMEIYTWDLDFLMSQIKNPGITYGCRLKKFSIEDLSDAEWKKIKKNINSGLEKPKNIERIKADLSSNKLKKIKNAVSQIVTLRERARSCINELIALIKNNNDDETRLYAVVGLRSLRKHAAPAIPVIIETFSNIKVRCDAIEGLNQIGIADKDAEKAVLKVLANPSVEDEFHECIEYLDLVGTDSKLLIKPLSEAIHNPEEEVRYVALLTLADYGELAAPYLDQVLPFLKSESFSLRNAGLKFFSAVEDSKKGKAKLEILELLESEKEVENIELANEILKKITS